MSEHTPNDFDRVIYLDSCPHLAGECCDDLITNFAWLDGGRDEAHEISEQDARDLYPHDAWQMGGKWFLYIEDGVVA